MSLDIDNAIGSAADLKPAAVEKDSASSVDDSPGEVAAADSDQDGVRAHLDEAGAPRKPRLRDIQWSRVFAYCVLPLMAVLLAAGAGYLKWLDGSAAQSRTAAMQSVQTASDTTVAMLAYQPDTAEKDLTAAANRMTGAFRDDYLKLINDIVIPGSREKRISAAATVRAAASVSASTTHAVVLVFVNQTTIIDDAPPTDSLSSVRVTLDKVNDRWLVSQFEPV